MSKEKHIIVSVTNDIYTDQRVRKICEFLVEMNYSVTLVGRKLKYSTDLSETSYKVKRFVLPFNKGALFYASYNIRLFFFLLFHKADVLLANDLDTLYANHWAKKFKKNCKLIYDSHEYFIGVPELIARPKIQRVWRFIEKRTLPKVDAMYTVNKSIATLYKKEYGIDAKVVRNISDFKPFNKAKTRTDLGLPLDKKIIIIQGAGINIDRGAEEFVNAIQLIDNAVLIFVGDGDVIPAMKFKVCENKLFDKVLFFGKRSYEDLMNFTRLSDLGISFDKDTNVNYRFSLPNKVFDYIHAGIPLFVSNLPEVKKIVKGYQVGIICNSHNPRDIADAIIALFEDEKAIELFKKNTILASKELTWKNECKILKTIF